MGARNHGGLLFRFLAYYILCTTRLLLWPPTYSLVPAWLLTWGPVARADGKRRRGRQPHYYVYYYDYNICSTTKAPPPPDRKTVRRTASVLFLLLAVFVVLLLGCIVEKRNPLLLTRFTSTSRNWFIGLVLKKNNEKSESALLSSQLSH